MTREDIYLASMSSCGASEYAEIVMYILIIAACTIHIVSKVREYKLLSMQIKKLQKEISGQV